jgi:hypothetical protein
MAGSVQTYYQRTGDAVLINSAAETSLLDKLTPGGAKGYVGSFSIPGGAGFGMGDLFRITGTGKFMANNPSALTSFTLNLYYPGVAPSLGSIRVDFQANEAFVTSFMFQFFLTYRSVGQLGTVEANGMLISGMGIAGMSPNSGLFDNTQANQIKIIGHFSRVEPDICLTMDQCVIEYLQRGGT